MHSFDQKFAFRAVSGSEQFQHTQLYKVTERIIIVFRTAYSPPFVGNVDYQLLQ